MKSELLKNTGFQQGLAADLTAFLREGQKRFPEEDTIKIDLHCHDHNSDVPDELLGRILKVPETWLKTKRLIKTLEGHGVDAITITNHNNARSCYDVIEKGMDILVGAEFTCTVPDFEISIHVLTYGFTEEQEKDLNKLRRNLYNFLQYTHKYDLPTIWAHPLYYYSPKGIPSFDFFEKLALLFERFEVMNGQRDTWQNLLVKTWLENLTPEIIDSYAEKYDIDPKRYCKDPYKKAFSGGSDSHMGIFSGLAGTKLYIPNLKVRRKNEPLSQLALEALQKGNMVPYGTHQNSEKLTIAFLDYVFQIALNKKDQGLLRVLLHKGTAQDKTIALVVSNAFSELQRHKVTMNFIDLFHSCFMGKLPKRYKRWFIPPVYKPVFDDALRIARDSNIEGKDLVASFSKSIDSISKQLNSILYSRLDKKIAKVHLDDSFKDITLTNIIDHFELPSEIRTYIDKKNRWGKKKKYKTPDIGEFLDGLSFPFLASTLILAANFTSAKVLYNNRPLLEEFSNKLGKYQHPKRMLWLTDTFTDHNGVSMVLQAMHEEIKRRDLPIDILVCSNEIEPDDHLIVIKPLGEYKLPMYQQQPFRIPDFLEIHNLFHKGEYDRLICSTEGPMGLATMYLKNAYSVKAHFYIHTDWIMFARKVLKMDSDNISRFRRLLRAFYNNFDGLFVLNTDHQKWLSDMEMGFDPEKVFLTGHWAEDIFAPQQISKQEAFDLNETDKVLLFAGRISHEKGVMELPEIYSKVKEHNPDLKLVIAGAGPAEEELKAALPNAKFLGWIKHDDLPKIYAAADLLVLPSKFDTFSCVVLESLSCGLPVIAYKTKGPKDIIQHEENGYVVSSRNEMARSINEYFANEEQQAAFKASAIERAKYFAKDRIMKDFLKDVEL